MNDNSLERLKDIAEYIERFRELSEEEQSWIKQLLENGKMVLSTLELLEVIEEEALTFYEIADKLGCNYQTVQKKINALVTAGLPIYERKTGKYVSPKGGRPRKLKRKVHID